MISPGKYTESDMINEFIDTSKLQRVIGNKMDIVFLFPMQFSGCHISMLGGMPSDQIEADCPGFWITRMVNLRSNRHRKSLSMDFFLYYLFFFAIPAISLFLAKL